MRNNFVLGISPFTAFQIILIFLYLGIDFSLLGIQNSIIFSSEISVAHILHMPPTVGYWMI